MKKISFFLIFLIINTILFSQETKIKCEKIMNSGDCSSAIEINPINKLIFNCSNENFGNHLEIKNNSSKSIYFFEKEHHTIWLKFSCPYDALMSFDIIPMDNTYDFDFLLFKNNIENFCNQLMIEKLKPVRSNISRNNIKNNSISGLKIDAKDEFIHSGVQPTHSKAIEVNKTDSFFLVIDNVYGGKAGFSIEFNYYKNQNVNGTTIDNDNSNAVFSRIKIENANNGKIVAEGQSDSISGEFNLDFTANINEQYYLITESKNYFFSENLIDNSVNDDTSTSNIEIKIPRLEKNGNLKLHNLNFYGDSYEYLPSAVPSLNRLLSLMKTNSSLKILIEGHTNGCSNGVEDSQILSENRAKSIKSFLTKNGINELRLESKGFNCSKMLYPQMKTLWEQMMNRRVEILVLDF